MKTIADAHRELKGELDANAFLKEGVNLFFNRLDNYYVTFDDRYHQEDYYQYICTVEEFNNYKGESMKTVMDAVNEFRGILNERYAFESTTNEHYWPKGKMVGDDTNHDCTKFRAVCTREQFNTLVQECMTNFGRSVTYDEYKEQQENKVKVEIDYEYTGKSNGFFTHGKIYKVSECDGEHVTNDDNVDSRHEISDDYLSKNFVKLFTQEMSDNGELPSVGMECLIMYTSSNYKGTITYMGDGVGVYRSKDNNKEYTFALVSVKFRALDTRTDKEKAIDDIMKNNPAFIRADESDIRTVLNAAYDKWVGK